MKKSVFGIKAFWACCWFGFGMALLTPVMASSNTGVAEHALVIIDHDVQDPTVLAAAFEPDTPIIYLSDADTPATLSRALATHKNLDAVHLFSHGAPGKLHLAGEQLTEANLSQYQNLYSNLKQILGSDGELLLYACELAKGQVGSDFVDQLRQTTSLNIAASTNLTGSPEKGGDWALEIGQSRSFKKIENYSWVLADKLVFSANDDSGQRNLWGYNLDDGRIQPIAIPNPGGYGMVTRYDTFELNGKIYGIFLDEEGAARIGAYNGTDVEFIGSIPQNFDPEVKDFTVFDGDLYVTFEPSGDPRHIYRIDLSAQTVTDITGATLYDAAAWGMAVYNDGNGAKLYFGAEETNSSDATLWSWDGASLSEVSASPSHVEELASFNGSLYFSASASGTYNTQELHRYDGSSVSLVDNLSALGHDDANPRFFTEFSGKLFFIAGNFSKETMLFSVSASNNVSMEYNHSGNNAPSELVVASSNLYFPIDSAGSGGDDIDFYRYNSTGNVTNITSSIGSFTGSSFVRNIDEVNGNIVYQQDSGQGDEPHLLDLSANTVTQLANINDDANVADGDSLQNNGSRHFWNVLSGNLAPLVDAGNGFRLVGVDTTGHIINDRLNVYEVDSASITGGTVSISTGYQSGDLLSATDSDGITSSFDASTGVLSLSGTASKEAYQTVLRTVSFSSGSTAGERAILFQVTDSDANTSTSTNATGKSRFSVIEGTIVDIPFDTRPSGLNNPGGNYVGEFTLTDASLGDMTFKSTDSANGTAFNSLVLSVDAANYGLAYDNTTQELQVKIHNDGSFGSPQTLAFKADNPFNLIAFDGIDRELSTFDRYVITAYRNDVQVFQETITGGATTKDIYELSAANKDQEIDEFRINGSFANEWVDGFSSHFDNFVLVVPSSADSDGSLIAAGGVSEPVALVSRLDTVGEAVDVFDFTLSDGGTSDGLPLEVSEVRLTVDGASTSSDAERSKITWRLNGPDAGNVTGTYDAGTDTITFSGLGISVADSGSETYTVNAYYNDNTGLTEDHTIILSVDGDTDVTVAGSGTQMGATSAVTNGSGTTIDVVASQLAFTTQPSGAVSGSALSSQPVVTAQDAFGNTDIDFTETVTLTEASAGVLSNNSVAAVSGVATFTGLTYTATADQQSFTLTANDQDGVGSDLSTVDANALTANVVATKLVFGTQPAPTTVSSGASTNFTTVPVVRAVDANGVTDTGYSTDISLAEVNGAGSATLSATGDNDLSASTVSVTPTSGTTTFTGLSINYTASGSSNETFNLRASSGGLSTADSAQLTGSVTPTVSSVGVPANATYAAGQNLDFTVNTSANITVNTGGGTPRIALVIGGSTVYANYLSGSGTSTLTFRYTLQAGDLDADGISVGSLAANGGTLQNGSGNDLDTTLNLVGNTTAILVDAVDPTVSSVAVPAVGQYVAGQNLNFTLNASEAVTINTTGGTPRIPLTLGTTTRYARYSSGSGTSSLVFRYTVQAGDEDTDGIQVGASVDANGGTLRDSVGNDLNTSLNAVGNTSSVLVDAVVPTGHSVSFDDSTLNGSEATSVSFTFSAAEVDTDYSYSISSSGGGTPVTGSGTIASAGDQITGLNLSGLNDGTVTLSVTLTDSAGNTATAVTDTATLDTTESSVVLSSPAASVVNGAFDVTVTFDETVSGFDAGDISASNATLGNFAGSGASYSVTVTPTNDGSVTVDVAAGIAQDVAGNDNTAATQLGRIFDGTVPKPVLSSDLTATVTNEPIELTVDFGEAVTGFVSANLSVTNGSVTGFTDLGNGLFEATVAAAGDGDVTIEVEAGAAEDEAGNSSEAAKPLVVTFDSTGPMLQSSAPSAGASDVSYQSNLVLTFDEPVVAATGELVVQDVTDDAEHVRMLITDARVSINDTEVTVTLDENLIPTHEYYVTFAANSLEDEAGNGWAGIVSNTALRFTVANQAPQAANDSATLDQGSALVMDLLANDTDEEGGLNPASVRVMAQPAHGRVSVETGTGAVTYEPEEEYTGQDSFTYVVEDEFGGQSNAATVSLSVEPAGLPPVTRVDLAAVVPGGSVTLAPLANDSAAVSGVALDPQSAELVLRPHNGTAQWNQGELTYTAEADFEGVESLAYTVADANGVRSPVTRVFINVSENGIAPEAQDDSAETEMAAPVMVAVLSNDSATGATLANDTVELGHLPRHGIAEIDAATGDILYTPDADFRGQDVFYYTVRDDRGLVSNAAQVTVSVGVTGNPVAANDQVQVMGDATLAINVLGNDRGLDSALNAATLSLVDGPAQGLVALDTSAGVFRYTPDDAFSGIDTFTYTVQDSEGQVSAPATVTVSAQPGNNRPLANDRAVVVAEDSDTSVSPLANGQDLNGTLNPASLHVEQQPLNGTLSAGAGGTLSYSPAENFYGEDRFTYTVRDDLGSRSRLAVVRLVVAPVADDPLISGSPTSTIPAGKAYRFTPVATDIDGNPLTFSALNLPDWASFDSQNGRISGTPGLADVGSYDGITISVTNGDESTDLAAFSIQVTDSSGGSGEGGQGEPGSPAVPGEDEGSDIPVVDSQNPVVDVADDGWPSYTDDQPSKARYETTFIDLNGDLRTVSVTVDDPQAPLPVTESPNSSGQQTLTFSQSDGSEQAVAVTPEGQTVIAVFRQSGDATPASRLTSDATELQVTALAGGDILSKVVVETADGGTREITVLQSATNGVLVSGTRYLADGTEVDTTAVQFDLAPVDIELGADGTVSLTGEAITTTSATAVEYRITPDGAASAVSQYSDGAGSRQSSGLSVRQGGSTAIVMADGYIALEQPYADSATKHEASVASDGQVQYLDGGGNTTNLPTGSILIIDGEQASTGGRDLNPDGNGLKRAGQITGSADGQPTITRLEVTDVSNGNEEVFVSPAADGDGINASRSLSEGELSARIRLDGTSVNRLSGRDGMRDNQARSRIPGSLSLFFNDRVVTVADETDATLLTELLDNGEVRHEVAVDGESTRAFSYLSGSSTVIERDDNGQARVVTRAASKGRSLEAIANADGSARHQLTNRLGERSEADIRIPGAFTSLSEGGSLRSRVRFDGSNVCAWVETFGNGETGTGFGTYDPQTLTCQSLEKPTSQGSLFEAGNTVEVESESGEYTITIETRVTRPIRF